MQVGQRVGEALETDGWASRGPHMPFQVPSPASRGKFLNFFECPVIPQGL